MTERQDRRPCDHKSEAGVIRPQVMEHPEQWKPEETKKSWGGGPGGGDTHRHTDTDTQTHRHTDTDTHTETHTHTDTQTQTHRHRHTDTDTHRDSTLLTKVHVVKAMVFQ